jgi:hypothetical protein
MRLRAILAIVRALILAAVVAALNATAVAADKVWRIGWLDPNPPPTPGTPYGDLNAPRRGFGEVGYVEGRSYVIEVRFADTDRDRLQSILLRADEVIE